MMSESGVVYKTNNTGPNIKPCGTPNMTGEEEEADLLTTTHWFLSRRYDLNHWRAVERMPKTVLRRERRIWWSILSNAAERSSMSKTEISSSSIAFNRWLEVYCVRAFAVLRYNFPETVGEKCIYADDFFTKCWHSVAFQISYHPLLSSQEVGVWFIYVSIYLCV